MPLNKPNKRRFNWKARQVVETEIDDTATKKIKVDLNAFKEEKYDESNALLIPSKKRKTKAKSKNVQVTKILSKKQRKKLEKIVDQKKKKEKRASLLDALSQVQASPDDLKHMTSISTVQTKGLRSLLREAATNETEQQQHPPDKVETVMKVNSVAGSRRRKYLQIVDAITDKPKSDPNIVGFSESGSSDEEESEDEGTQGNEIEEDTQGNEDEEGIQVIEDDCERGNKEKIDLSDEDCVESGEESKISEINEAASESTVNIQSDTAKANEQLDRSSSDGVKSSDKEKPSPKPAVFVLLDRLPHIQEARMKLPILAEEQAIMELVNENQVVILAGETGSGKTTQVPQFLYEGGYTSQGKIIGLTEPRRVAAISMSKRVAEEMNLTSKEVSYLIRYEGNVTDDTKIKFMTDGVLMKEVQNDFLLSKYSVIIIDEAHERSIFTDILIGLLSRIVPLRHKRGNPLKLIIMSATLRVEDFTENTRLFKQLPPLLQVESRQFPVTIHFNKRTLPNYVREAYNKACKIHTQLPEGGILIFLTGQREVNMLVRKLRRTFPLKGKSKTRVPKDETKTDEVQQDEEEIDSELTKSIKRNKISHKKHTTLPEINLDNYSVLPMDDADYEMIDEDVNDIEEEEDEDEGFIFKGSALSEPMWVLPLYSLLSSQNQAKVFLPPPEGCRLCVVATNVAETSLTIPHVKYVIDSGKVKAKFYDKVTGVSAFHVAWTSKASANQRAGRAGRMGPGHCYRLYSSAVYNDQFEKFAIPDIQRQPVDDLVLQMKTMNIHKVINFPFPSAPDMLQLKCAEKRLILLGALHPPEKESNTDEWTSKVTPLGHAIAAFPVAPRYGKMLALSHQHNLLPYSICMVAALSVQEVLLETPVGFSAKELTKETRSKWIQMRRAWAGVGNRLLLGDPMVLICAVGAAEYAGCTQKFCEENGFRFKAMLEIRKLRAQLTNEVNLKVPDLNVCINPKMNPPSDSEAKLLRQIILAGMVDHVAHKVSQEEIKENEDRAKWKYAYRCGELEEPVFIHSSSVLRRNLPEWVVYQEVYETTKMYMRGVTAIEPEWLPTFAPSLCSLSPPLLEPPPRYESSSGKMFCYVSGTFGRAAWVLPTMEIEFPEGLDRYKWFAVFLLEGDVFPKLKKFRNSLLSMPSTMVKTWAKLQPRTDILLKALMMHEADSKEKLEDAWKKDPSYLLSAYRKWIPESAHNELALAWPPL